MKKFTFHLFLSIIFSLTMGIAMASAQQPAKGNWTFTTNTALGTLDIHCIFKQQGKGFIIGGPTMLPITYREQGNLFSSSFEGMDLWPDGSNISVVFRGVKVDDNTIEGNSIIIEEAVDLSNPTGFVTFQIPFVGKRDQ